MKRKFSSEEKEICWKLWRQGLGFSDIGRVINAKPGSIFTILRASGGYPPSKAIRSQMHLSLNERETISIGLEYEIRTIECITLRILNEMGLGDVQVRNMSQALDLIYLGAAHYKYG